MSDDEIRIAVALLLGWVQIPPELFTKFPLVTWPVFEKDGQRASIVTDTLPNWPNDLNACAVMETTMTADECWLFNRTLHELQGTAGGMGTGFVDEWAWHATARQRCEAFLRVKGKDRS